MNPRFGPDWPQRRVVFGQPVVEQFRDPAGYLASVELQAAVDVALLLGMPLLLTGDPGSGKTSVAAWLAWSLNLGTPLVHNVKSTTTGRELLYEFDDLARFRDAQAGGDTDPTNYLRLNALGEAILRSGDLLGPLDMPTRAARGSLPEVSVTRGDFLRLVKHRAGADDRVGLRQVVLIDELDKAPRDTPNDLLHEILEMKFWIREIDVWIQGDPALRPVVIIASNSEKNLPEPFLRRCVFHHIAKPDADARRAIVERRMHPFARHSILFDAAMRLFDRLANELGRAPGTAELLAWLTVLQARWDAAGEDDRKQFANLAKGSLGVLAKTDVDLERAEAALASSS